MNKSIFVALAGIAICALWYGSVWGYGITVYQNAQCSGGTHLGTLTFQSSDVCESYCSGRTASCCTTKVTNIDGYETWECGAYANTTSRSARGPEFTCTGGGEPICTDRTWTASVFDYAGSPVTATIVANPSTVPAGTPSLLTWSSTGAASCTGTNFSTGNATAGSVWVTPSATTVYTLVCVNTAGTVSATSQTVVLAQTLTVSCGLTGSTWLVGSTVTWSAAPSGGSGYTYSWSGTDGLTGSTQSVSKQYALPGYKSARVTVTSGSRSVTTDCPYSTCTGTCACASDGSGCTAEYRVGEWYTWPSGTLLDSILEQGSYPISCDSWAQSEGYTYWNAHWLNRPYQNDPVQTVCTGTNTPPSGTVIQSSGSVSSDSNTYARGRVCATPTGCGVIIRSVGRDLSAGVPDIGTGSLTPGGTLSFTGNILSVGSEAIDSVFQNRFQVDIGNNDSYDVVLDQLGGPVTFVEEQIGMMCSGGTLVRQYNHTEDDGAGGVDITDHLESLSDCELNLVPGECCQARYWTTNEPYPVTNYTYYSVKIYNGTWTLVPLVTPSTQCPETGIGGCLSAITNTKNGVRYDLLPGSQAPAYSPNWTNIPPGTHAVRACADIPSESFPESNENNNCGANYVFTVPGPDFTASTPNVNSGSLIAGQAITFFGTATNSGTSHTENIPTRFQVDLGSNGTWDTNLDTTTAGLTQGQSKQPVSPVWTGVQGTHVIRMCIDTPPSIPESNENNNCSSTSLVVTVSAPAQCQDGIDNNGNGLVDHPADPACTGPGDTAEEVFPPATLSLTASKATVQKGETVSLTWSATNVQIGTCSISSTAGNTWPQSGTSGTQVSSALTGETRFTLSCRDIKDNALVQRSVTVRVAPYFEEI